MPQAEQKMPVSRVGPLRCAARSMLTERRIECLRDIVKYCDQIEAFLHGFTREAFDVDLRTQNAVLYSLQRWVRQRFVWTRKRSVAVSRDLWKVVTLTSRGETFAASRTSCDAGTTISISTSSGPRPLKGFDRFETLLIRK